jgi:hypothetical protein
LLPGAFDLALSGGYTGTGPSVRVFENSADNSIVQVDVDESGKTDMQMTLLGTSCLGEANFIL